MGGKAHGREYFLKYYEKRKLPPLALMASLGGLGTETLLGMGKSQL
jgi:hypothetical protein